jgi:uridine phosphorylase
MGFPNFKGKHMHEALFNPNDFAMYRDWNLKEFPKKYIITYQKSALSYFKRKYRGKFKAIKLDGSEIVYKYRDIGFVKMLGIGAPNASAVLEELIAVGGKEFINVGTAGGLQEPGVFLCEKAIRDEGTSYHYISHGKYSYPDKALTEKLRKSLEKNKIVATSGISWTIDTPYRETKKEVLHYKKQGVATVEMEASAIFAVAKFRKVKIASAFIVSDILGEKWDPRFHRLDVRKIQNKIIDSAIDCLLKGGKR